MQGQTYNFNQIATSATVVSAQPSTDGTTVVFIDSAGNISAAPIGGGNPNVLVSGTGTLPNGLGAISSFSIAGWPIVKNGKVYFGAMGASGSGYYSVPLTGGSITVIIDSTTKDSAGRTVTASALSRDLLPTYFTFSSSNQSDLPVAGVDRNLFLPSGGGAIFTAGLVSSGGSIDQAVLSLSPTGVLSTVLDTGTLSGCSNISSFATDGTIYTAWASTTANHIVLLENNAPSLNCSNVLVDLGVPGTNSTGILPGQLSTGSIDGTATSAATVIDSGFIYFSATLSLVDKTNNLGYYSGIFRIQPGGTIQQVVASTDTRLGAPLSPDLSLPTTLLCTSFAVLGNNVVLPKIGDTHYGYAAGVYVEAFYYLNQSAGTLNKIAQTGDLLSSNHSYYPYSSSPPTPFALSANGQFVFNVSTLSTVPGAGPNGSATYSVNLNLTSTSTSIAAPATATFGSPVSLTATVSKTGSSVPTGSVVFYSGTTSVGTATINTSGVASLSTLLPTGTDAITAVYNGDALNSTSTSAAATVVVGRATPTITLTSSATSLAYGTAVTFTSTVTGIAGATAPQQNVAFDDGATVLATIGVGTNGVSSYSTNSLPLGSNTVLAAYNGDTNYLPVVSSSTAVNVTGAITSTALSSSVSTTPFGTTVTLTALVTSSQPNPSGTVTFTSNGVAIGTGAVNAGGSAILAVNNLPIGTASVQASFAVTSAFAASMSNTVQVIITAPTLSLVAGSGTSLTVHQAQTATTVIMVNALGALSSPVAFACGGLPQFATCSFSPRTVTPGTAGASTTLTIATNVSSAALQLESKLWYAGIVLLGLGGLRGALRRIELRVSGVFSLLLLFAIYGLTGCGSSANSSVTPAGTSSVSVVATSGTVTQTLGITLTVSP